MDVVCGKGVSVCGRGYGVCGEGVSVCGVCGIYGEGPHTVLFLRLCKPSCS